MVTAAAAGFTVTVAEADFVVSVLLVAVTVAVVAVLTLAAVYLPVPSTVPPPLPTDQFTPAESPVTVAVNWTVPPEVTVAVDGETVTEMVPPVVVLLPPPQPARLDRMAHTDRKVRPIEKCLRMVVPAV
jgi:hypothetical protein